MFVDMTKKFELFQDKDGQKEKEKEEKKKEESKKDKPHKPKKMKPGSSSKADVKDNTAIGPKGGHIHVLFMDPSYHSYPAVHHCPLT